MSPLKKSAENADWLRFNLMMSSFFTHRDQDKSKCGEWSVFIKHARIFPVELKPEQRRAVEALLKGSDVLVVSLVSVMESTTLLRLINVLQLRRLDSVSLDVGCMLRNQTVSIAL